MNKFAGAVTIRTKACDKRLARLISYIHHTREYKQYCHVGNTAQQCRLGLFQDSDCVGDLEDSKSTSGGVLCIFGSHTFVPISWMCKKQTSVSHSSTEAEIISLGAWLRMDGIPALASQTCTTSSNASTPTSFQLALTTFHPTQYILVLFEDNEAVIKMIIKGRRPTTRHVSRTHRVALDWLFDRINLDPKNQNPLH